MARSHAWRALAAGCAAVLLLGTGCVERLLEIRSEPSNATLLLNGEEVGRTPYVTTFHHYGVHEVMLSAPRCERLRAMADVRPPWYQRFPLDFLFELLLPAKFTDHQVFDFQLTRIKGLEELSPEDTAAILERAEELRQRVKSFGEPE